MMIEQNTELGMTFFDMQAAVGITKHIGGFAATNELLALCHIADAHDALNVGCGIGVGPAYIAKQYQCHVVGVDVSEQMIAWSQQRAREEGVEAKVAFYAADVLHLPFKADQFDVVVCESVLDFVEDKPQAIRECVRVTKPGGYVGLNEGVWMKPPPAELVAQVRDALGPAIPTLATWQALWDGSFLQERVVRIHQIDARAELKSRLEWIGWRWLLRAWGRALHLYLTNPAIRHSMKAMFDVPADVFEYVGYGLFVGRK